MILKIIECSMLVVEYLDEKLLESYEYLRYLRQGALTRMLDDVEKEAITLRLVEAELESEMTSLDILRADIEDKMKHN